MLNEKKIRIMTKLAVFEDSEGKKDIDLSKYYKNDYIRLHLIKTIISVTIGYLILLGMIAFYKSEELIRNAVSLDYESMGFKILGGYIIFLTIYILGTAIAYSVKYDRSKRKLSVYLDSLKALRSLYKEEEKDMR